MTANFKENRRSKLNCQGNDLLNIGEQCRVQRENLENSSSNNNDVKRLIVIRCKKFRDKM